MSIACYRKKFLDERVWSAHVMSVSEVTYIYVAFETGASVQPGIASLGKSTFIISPRFISSIGVFKLIIS